jgi:hypothetical protein
MAKTPKFLQGDPKLDADPVRHIMFFLTDITITFIQKKIRETRSEAKKDASSIKSNVLTNLIN